MSLKEENLKVFEGKPLKSVFFQPRLEYWYQRNREKSTLPEKFRNMSLLDVFDYFGASLRYIDYYTGLKGCIDWKTSDKVKEEIIREENKITKIRTTSKGKLVEVANWSVSAEWFFTTEFSVKNADDIESGIEFWENTQLHFMPERFLKGTEFIGDRGEPQFYLPKSGYQMLAQAFMRYEDLIYALNDYPDKVERLMKAFENSCDSLYEEIIASGLVKIVNFGENVDVHIDPPQYFEKYCIPYYEKRSNQLRKAGIHTHIHIDGNFKPLLKYLKFLPFDGLEALTPEPQGDVTLEEIKENIGNKVLLDGIPAIIFLPNYPMKKFEECVKKIIKLFHPKLILGASDELPPASDPGRIKYVADLCKAPDKNA